MRRWLFFILISLAVNSAFTQGNIVWPQSDSEIITNANATIAIQESNFPNITLEGYENIPANAYIGVFYTDGFDYGCGGFSQWPDNDENFVIAAFGDDPFTSAVVNMESPSLLFPEVFSQPTQQVIKPKSTANKKITSGDKKKKPKL